MGIFGNLPLTSQTCSKVNRGFGTNFVVEAFNGYIYEFFYNYSSGQYCRYTTDNGKTWTDPIQIFQYSGSFNMSIWYDRWSGLTTDLIHIVYNDLSNKHINYRKVNVANGVGWSLSSEVTLIHVVSFQESAGGLSITRTRGGNLAVLAEADSGVEYGFFTSTDIGVTWVAKDTTNLVEVGNDIFMLLPGWAADNQDVMCFYWDASATEISRKLFDDSGNSWSEASIATSMTYVAAQNSALCMAATVDITNSQNLLVAWSATDSANADLRCWKITEAAITEVTNVVLNSTDDQAMCAIAINTSNQYWYVFYCGKSDGSETVYTSLNIYYKVSQDMGVTWGSETKLTTFLSHINELHCSPRFTNNPIILFGGDYNVRTILSLASPHTTYQLGL